MPNASSEKLAEARSYLETLKFIFGICIKKKYKSFNDNKTGVCKPYHMERTFYSHDCLQIMTEMKRRQIRGFNSNVAVKSKDGLSRIEYSSANTWTTDSEPNACYFEH